MLTTAPRPTLDRLTTPDPDDLLVLRAAGGDERAFGELMRRHSALLHGVVHGILRSSSDADDVVQETFIAAWTRLDSVLDGAAIVGWLVTTARRRSYDRLRGSSYDEIGVELGVPKSTVRGLLARARLVLETDLALWR